MIRVRLRLDRVFPAFSRRSIPPLLVASVLGWALLSQAPAAQEFTRITGANPVLSDLSTGYSGAAWIDVDADGDVDLFVNNTFLYRNRGNFQFSRLTTSIGSGFSAITGNGTTWADYDNDGDADVYVCSSNSFLYENDGAGSFTQVLGGDIGQGFANRGWSCAWADVNNDGVLDLAITHPAGFVPPVSNPITNQLLVSNGPPNYTFTRMNDTPISDGFDSYTVGTWSDFDDDGDMDYFVGAGPADGTLQADYLYRNLLAETGSVAFERMTEAPLATDLQDGQIWNWVDYDNDGDLDAYLTNWGGPLGGLANRLYRNDDGEFTRVESGNIVTDADISLSSVWGDYDNDGDLDCFVTNDSGQPDRYYSNNGDGTFTSLTNALTVSQTHRGASAGDVDDDGDLDLYVDGPSGVRGLFRNDTDNGNHWLEVRLTGVASNRSAIGAKIRLRATIGGNAVSQLREISAQNTFNGQNSLVAHFGLGDAGSVESLRVEWPSGIVQTLTGVAPDQQIEIVEDTLTLPLPDGNAVPGAEMLVVRSGDDVMLSWDAGGCPAVAVNVYFGSLGDFSTFDAGACDLPAIGSATLAAPDDSWFLVAATDGGATDGSYGRDGEGAEREIAGAGSVCAAISQHVVNDGCP